MSRRHALVTHIRMPAVDRDAGSQLVDHTIRFLLDGGWRVTFLAKEEPDVAERRHADRLRRMGVPAYAGFAWAERLLRSASFDLALISYWEPAAALVPLVRRLSPQHPGGREHDRPALPPRRTTLAGAAGRPRRCLRRRRPPRS